MPNDEILVPKVFEPIFTGGYDNYVLPGGRVSGKSANTEIVVGIHTALKPDEDIVICRASYGSIADSVYNETCEVLENIKAFEGKFVFRKSPLRIVRKSNEAAIYYMGVGGSIDRTKGFKPKHKVGLVIIEETQELKTREHYDQLMATLRRRFGKDCVVITVFNPPAQELHWINVWCKEKEHDPDFCVIHSTYLDILQFLSDRDIKEIRKMYYQNRQYHDYMYGGIPTGGYGAVYPMFRIDKHVITYEDYEYIIKHTGIRPVACVIGGDGAVNRDATAFVAGIILSNGQCVEASIFYHNPKEDGSFGYHQLVKDFVSKWFDDFCNQFHLGTRQEMYLAAERQMNITMIPITMVIDSAAPDLIKECQLFLGDRATVLPIKKSTIPQMVATCQSALCNDSCVIIEYNGYYNYVRNQWVERKPNILAEQLSMLIWNEKQDGYDPIVANDVCDAWTYKTLFWYGNIENLAFFDILKANSISNELICDILKKRKGEEQL